MQAKLNALKGLDLSGYIAIELWKAGFHCDELNEFVHEIVVKLLVSPVGIHAIKVRLIDNLGPL